MSSAGSTVMSQFEKPQTIDPAVAKIITRITRSGLFPDFEGPHFDLAVKAVVAHPEYSWMKAAVFTRASPEYITGLWTRPAAFHSALVRLIETYRQVYYAEGGDDEYPRVDISLSCPGLPHLKTNVPKRVPLRKELLSLASTPPHPVTLDVRRKHALTSRYEVLPLKFYSFECVVLNGSDATYLLPRVRYRGLSLLTYDDAVAHDEHGGTFPPRLPQLRAFLHLVAAVYGDAEADALRSRLDEEGRLSQI